MKNALLVFVRNPVLGKMKTRLARTLGDEKALVIYRKLLQHTQLICESVIAEKYLFYSDAIVDEAAWKDFEPRLQLGTDLGEKIYNAFSYVLKEPAYDEEPLYEKAVIIGSDCYELTTSIIQEAFLQLEGHDVVIGPAADGGYYLLGMKETHPFLFQNKSWSTEKVLRQTLADLKERSLSYYLLPVLNDVDEEKDLIGTDLLAL